MLRSTRIRQYAEAITESGHSVSSLLRNTKIDASKLDDPNYLIEQRQYETVVANLLKITGDRGIGLDMGFRVDPDKFGVLLRAVLSAPTLHEGIQCWARYSSRLIGNLTRLTILKSAEDNSWSSTIHALPQNPDLHAFLIEEVLGLTARLSPEMATLVMREVRLPYPAPAHARRYRQLFSCPIRFNADSASAIIESPSLEVPLRGANGELYALCEMRCKQIMRALAGEDSLVPPLRARMLNKPDEIPSIRRVAEEFGLNERTLRRRLSAENTSYHLIASEVRYSLAKEYLASGMMSQDELAATLGYQDTNALRRAFKTWSGHTLGEYSAIHAAKRRRH